MSFQLNEWLLKARLCLFSPPRSEDKLQAYRLRKRLVVYLAELLFRTEPGPWQVPVQPPLWRRKWKPKIVLMCLPAKHWVPGLWCQPGGGGDIKVPFKGREKRGELNFVIWPVCVATCFGCGLVQPPCWQQMAFDVRVKRFGGILERLHAVLRWD